MCGFLSDETGDSSVPEITGIGTFKKTDNPYLPIEGMLLGLAARRTLSEWRSRLGDNRSAV
jgi:hypothetical protein